MRETAGARIGGHETCQPDQVVSSSPSSLVQHSRGVDTSRLCSAPQPRQPVCLTICIAADCAIDPTGPGCRVDSDGDRCIDVAEAEARFDPFDAADCVSTAGGQPAINCLFFTENLACNGDRIADPKEPECTAEREIRQRRSPTTLSGCDEVDQPPTDDCAYAVRDPGCDGFAPGESE